MDSIDPSIAVKATSALEASVKAATEARVTQSKLDRIAPFQDVAKFRAKAHDTREEATKNLESIRSRLKEISASLNEDMSIRSKNLKFSVGESPYRVLVKVLDKESGELIREIPSEAILKVAHNLEALKGIIFDDKF